MLADARRLVAGLEVMRARVKNLKDGLEAELSIAFSVMVPSQAVVMVLREFRAKFPSVTVNLMVGGPEGLAPEVCARSEQRWSLSPLTLPHPLVRVLLGEQIYRAWTVLSGHPYHK